MGFARAPTRRQLVGRQLLPRPEEERGPYGLGRPVLTSFYHLDLGGSSHVEAPPAGAHLRRPELGLLRDHEAAHDVPQQGAGAALRDSRGEGGPASGTTRGVGLPQ